MKLESERAKRSKAEAKRSADLAIRGCEEAFRRSKAQVAHAMDLEEMRQARLVEDMEALKKELEEKKKQCVKLQEDLEQGQKTIGSHSEELHNLQMRLVEEKVRCETLTASRDHFQRKVQELCKKLLQEEDLQVRGKPEHPSSHPAMPVHSLYFLLHWSCVLVQKTSENKQNYIYITIM